MAQTMELRSNGEAGRTATGKISIIMFSGTADKFIPLGVITQAAAIDSNQVSTPGQC